jgi:predicted dehydrogenase
MSERKLRWGIMGAGNITKSVIPGIQASRTGEVTAVASRDAAKARAHADRYGIPKSYGSYEELLADPDIDAVYIPLPNHLHKPWTIRAAKAGKHVLCEKPIALDAAEAKEMVEACAASGVVLAEAFMYRHHPRYDRIREIIASGEIGDIRGIHGTFTFNNAKNTTNIRYKQEWGGGSVYDVGCYPISAARLILGKEPVAATAHAFFSPEHGGVDMMTSGLVEFDGGVALTFDCAMWAAGRNTLEVLGTDGRIEVPFAFLPQAGKAGFFVITKDGRREEPVEDLNQYTLQADDFASAVAGKPQRFPPEDCIFNMKVIDAVLKSARERVRVEIQP